MSIQDDESGFVNRLRATMIGDPEGKETSVGGYAREKPKGRPGLRERIGDQVVRACRTARPTGRR